MKHVAICGSLALALALSGCGGGNDVAQQETGETVIIEGQEVSVDDVETLVNMGIPTEEIERAIRENAANNPSGDTPE